MELRFVSTGSIHFRTGVDQEVGLGTTPDEEMEPLLGAEQVQSSLALSLYPFFSWLLVLKVELVWMEIV